MILRLEVDSHKSVKMLYSLLKKILVKWAVISLTYSIIRDGSRSSSACVYIALPKVRKRFMAAQKTTFWDKWTACAIKTPRILTVLTCSAPPIAVVCTRHTIVWNSRRQLHMMQDGKQTVTKRWMQPDVSNCTKCQEKLQKVAKQLVKLDVWFKED